MSFEKRLMAHPKSTPSAVSALIAQVFNDVNGQTLLALLCETANPLDHSVLLSAHDHGQREVISTLWRHGVASTLAKPSTPTN